MDDEMIYKKDAIDALRGLPRWVMDPNGEFQPVDPPAVSMLDPDDAVSAIENLPAVGIIGCEYCAYHEEPPIADGRYWCSLHDDFMYYCSDVERQEE